MARADTTEHLRKVSLFSSLDRKELETLARLVKERRYPAGTTIVRSGETGHGLYVIMDGAVSVRKDGKTVARLGSGDFFGEIALLRDVPRTATVTALEETRLYSLNWDSFVPAVTGYAPSRHAAETVIGTRLGAVGLARA